MNELLTWLKGGDLRSDGLSMQVVRFVLDNPELIVDLLDGLDVDDDTVRGRSADALEHIARELPHILSAHQTVLHNALKHDPIPMVRWHIAMIVGHMALEWDDPDDACELLVGCLSDGSIFVISWAIVSLCIYARLFPHLFERTFRSITKLTQNPSIAVRSKVRNAVLILNDQDHAMPNGWVKSPTLRQALAGS